MSHYVAYYDAQAGGGGVDHVFVGSPHQRGHGIGSFLGGLFRRALPLLQRGARAVGKEALRTGMNILDDVGTNNVPFKQSLKHRFQESRDNLKRKADEKLEKLMEGGGYKKVARRRKKQSKVGRKQRRTPAKKKKTVKRKSNKRKISKKKKRSVTDIFGPA